MDAGNVTPPESFWYAHFSIPSSDHRAKNWPTPTVPHTFASDMVRAGVSPASPHAVDGTRANPDGAGLCASHSSRGLSAVRASCGAAHQARAGHDVVKLSRYAPLEHPFALSVPASRRVPHAALAPNSARQYRGVAR